MSTKSLQAIIKPARSGPELGLRCWGWNDFGQVGEPTGQSKKPYDPEVDDGAHQPVGLYVGKYSVCSSLDGRIFCWGMNPFGILGRARSEGSNRKRHR